MTVEEYKKVTPIASKIMKLDEQIAKLKRGYRVFKFFGSSEHVTFMDCDHGDFVDHVRLLCIGKLEADKKKLEDELQLMS